MNQNLKMTTKVQRKRHLLKSITWRIAATLFTFTVVFILTGNIKISLGIGGIEFVGKLLLYYIHERLWYKYSKFGVERK